jgi:hypothetical protein
VSKPDGTSPSVAELSQEIRYRNLLDSLPGAYFEKLVADCLLTSQLDTKYPAYAYFSIQAYKDGSPGYYYKTASPEAADADPLGYGWSITKWIPAEDILLADYPMRYTPGIPTILGLSFDGQTMTLKVNFQSFDQDDDLLGYTIFVSNHSRGWDYNQFYGDESVINYWANPDGWRPFMYENLFAVPPSDVMLITRKAIETQVEIPVERGKTYYITVMPFDAYGKMIGRNLYPESNEIEFSAK